MPCGMQKSSAAGSHSGRIKSTLPSRATMVAFRGCSAALNFAGAAEGGRHCRCCSPINTYFQHNVERVKSYWRSSASTRELVISKVRFFWVWIQPRHTLPYGVKRQVAVTAWQRSRDERLQPAAFRVGYGTTIHRAVTTVYNADSRPHPQVLITILALQQGEASGRGAAAGVGFKEQMGPGSVTLSDADNYGLHSLFVLHPRLTQLHNDHNANQSQA
jgi:hypothetical protein